MPYDGIWNVEWPNVNAGRKFPLAQPATTVDLTGSFTLPTNLLVDLSIAVPSATFDRPDGFFLSKLGVFSNGLTLTFSYQPLAGPAVDVAAAAVARTSFLEYRPIQVAGIGQLEGATIWLTLGHIDAVLAQPGLWQFDLDGGRIDPFVIRPDLKKVGAFYVQNGSVQEGPIYGDISLVAGANIRFRVVGNIIYLDAVPDDSLGAQEDCEGRAPLGRPICTINGRAPGTNGDFTIQPGTCISLEAIDHGLEINDTCSEPCCDCTELQVLVDTVTELRRQVEGLDNLAGQLDTAMQTSTINLAAAKTTGLP